MRIQLSEHFTYPKLIRFVLPSVVMMIFTSIYSVVDGLFVSNFVGKTPFAAVNLIMPLLMAIGSLGFMIGAGGTAIVARTLGEGHEERAKRYFSLLVYVTAIGGAVLAAVGQLLLPQISALLGAEGAMLKDCVLYGRIILCAMPFFMLQNVFQSFFVTAEKAQLGLFVTVAAGLTNMALDALFVAVLPWGLAGAALATTFSQVIGGIVPVFYFMRKNDSLLRLTRTQLYGRILLKACTNGSSELMSNISASVVTMLYNHQLLRLAGEDGIAAYGVMMYVSFIFAAIFIGYAVGGAPVISYHFGAGNTAELKNLFRKSMVLVSATGAVMTLSAIAASAPLSGIFVGYDPALYDMTVHGFRVIAFAFLFSGVNIFGSAFFTALNNGAVSAAISFLRTLLFQSASVLILPLLWGLNGVWAAVIAAELFALMITVSFLIAKRKKYQYI
ncbi:MAG: MATE family efflux transporter [Clostridiales bacterium]|nr:MATE family efflux transporter [Clostridiales bacterium]